MSQRKNEVEPASSRSPRPEAAPAPEWDVIVGLKRTNFSGLVTRLAYLKSQEAEIKEEKEELKAKLIPMLIKAGVKTVMMDGIRVTKTDGSTSKLDKKLLVEKHGSKVIQWLAECTIKTPNTGLLLTLPGDEEEGD